MRAEVGDIAVEYRWDGRTPGDRDAEREPDGRLPVVLCHSLATNLALWAPQVADAALAERYPLLSYDIRGHGATSVTPPPYSAEGLAQDLLGLLDTLAVPRVHLVGLSLGGMVSLAFATRFPERLASLVVCGAPAHTPAETLATWDERISTAREQGMEAHVEPTVGRWFTPSFVATRPDVVDPVRKMIRRTEVMGYIGCAEAVKHHDERLRLPLLAVPTLIVAGSQDPGFPLERAEELHELILTSELAVIRPAAHLCNLEQPGQFNATLLDFLDQVEAAR